MEIEKNSAILIGNGINRYAEIGGSWQKLLKDLIKKVRAWIVKEYKSDVKRRENILGNLDRLTPIIFRCSSITYPEIFDVLYNCVSDDISLSEKTNIKTYLASLIYKNDRKNAKNKVTSLLPHKKILDFASANNIPILTTNYDTGFENSLDSIIKNTESKNIRDFRPSYIPGKTKIYRYTDFHYYSNNEFKIEEDDILKFFGIWHIHGLTCYPSSIRIGAEDYGYSIAHYNSLIHADIGDHKNKGLDEYKGLYIKDNNKILINKNWIGKNSWLDIFLNVKNLYIIGLELNSQETSLRWLLQARRKNLNIREKPNNTYYVTVQDTNKNISGCKNIDLYKSEQEKKYLYYKGQEIFFKSVGVNIKQENSFKDIYENWKLV